MDLIIGLLAGLICFICGLMLGRSFKKYDGVINVQSTESGGMLYSLELHDDPENLNQKKNVVFKIQPNDSLE